MNRHPKSHDKTWTRPTVRFHCTSICLTIFSGQGSQSLCKELLLPCQVLFSLRGNTSMVHAACTPLLVKGKRFWFWPLAQHLIFKCHTSIMASSSTVRRRAAPCKITTIVLVRLPTSPQKLVKIPFNSHGFPQRF